jgi:tRNA (cytidine32/uridine32-2'-O)-methyltransferase
MAKGSREGRDRIGGGKEQVGAKAVAQFTIYRCPAPDFFTAMSASAHIRFVLVGTQHPGNIGAAARAMKTMGLSRLVLVAPENPLDDVAFRRSAGAEDVLGDAPVFGTLAEAVADCRLVLGCTARARRVQLEELLPEVAGQRAVAKAGEPAGLTNDELQLCHAAVHIPSDPGFSSLNLAAAVQVLAYEVRMAALESPRGAPLAAAHQPPGQDDTPASHSQIEGLFGQLGDTLDQIDFHKGRAPESAMRKLRRLFMKAELSEQEVRLLRGILSDAQRMARLAAQRHD